VSVTSLIYYYFEKNHGGITGVFIAIVTNNVAFGQKINMYISLQPELQISLIFVGLQLYGCSFDLSLCLISTCSHLVTFEVPGRRPNKFGGFEPVVIIRMNLDDLRLMCPSKQICTFATPWCHPNQNGNFLNLSEPKGQISNFRISLLTYIRSWCLSETPEAEAHNSSFKPQHSMFAAHEL